jgi:FtsH ternary system domain X5
VWLSRAFARAPERAHASASRQRVKRGFTLEGNVARKSPEPGIVIEIDGDASTITVKVESDLDLKLRGEEHQVPADGASQALARQRIEIGLESIAKEKAELARRELTERLEGKLRDLKVEIDDAVTRATGEALKEKARSMGEVKEITEDPETGSLTIKIEL